MRLITRGEQTLFNHRFLLKRNFENVITFFRVRITGCLAKFLCIEKYSNFVNDDVIKKTNDKLTTGIVQILIGVDTG